MQVGVSAGQGLSDPIQWESDQLSVIHHKQGPRGQPFKFKVVTTKDVKLTLN